ncbi:MAG: F0F1 ATP synthase subunit B [Steroidobacteraceae bacterium]
MLELNATFIGQIIVFLILVWVLAKYGVPPLTRANSERRQKIADGLAAADRGQKELEAAATRSEQLMREARERARAIEDQAARRANELLAEAKQNAEGEGARIVQAARAEADNEAARTREALQREFGQLVVAGASRLLEREIDPAAHAQLLDELARDIARP